MQKPSQNVSVQPISQQKDDEVSRLYRLIDRADIQAKLPNDLTEVRGPVLGNLYRNLISSACPSMNIVWEGTADFVAAYIWGHSPCRRQLDVSEARRIPLILCEDGFIRSLDTWCNKVCPERDRTGVSLVMDDIGYYFDASRKNRLMRMLDSKELEISESDCEKARDLIKTIVGEKVTKYNHQPLTITQQVGRPGKKKVLVIDQSYGDFAIKRGGANDQTFVDMLSDACMENQDCDILVKTHPDAIAPGTKRKGYYQGLKQHGNIYPITFPCNPYSLMEHVDKVYVCSSQFGLEALMAGKEVHVYGRPFYAGWGLTIDKQDFKYVRSRTRSLEDLVYIAYFIYTHWRNPDTNKACTVEEAIEWIIRNRKCR